MKMTNNHINYVEFKARDLVVTREFYSKCFGWEFKAYGETYCSFSESGLMGGFEKTDTEISNGALVVLYHNDLEVVRKTVIDLGGNISREIFSFPGGRRFHFTDPSGNELAIWSDNE